MEIVKGDNAKSNSTMLQIVAIHLQDGKDSTDKLMVFVRTPCFASNIVSPATKYYSSTTKLENWLLETMMFYVVDSRRKHVAETF